jgi:CheY-like chemotaxis protein
VAVIDIGLPDLSGYEVAIRLRALAATAGIGLIALTGYGQDGDRSRALESGFDIHLTKPANLGALVEAIAKASNIVSN